MTIGKEDSTNCGLNKANANGMIVNGQIFQFFAQIRIEGWEG